MTWFRIDDNFALHPKVLAAGNAAIGLWARAGAWSAQLLTDGRVPAEIVFVLGGSQEDADRLVSAGLWRETLSGYEFHEWEERQPTRASVESRRRATRERVADWRSKQADDPSRNAVTNTVRNAVSNVPPDPARPGPKPKSVHADARTERELEFDRLWLLWPRKQSKKVARDRFVKLKSSDYDLARQQIEAHALAYVDGEHPVEFVPMLSTWLNQERWNDDPPAPRGGATPKRKHEDSPMMTKLDEWLAERGVSREEYDRRKTETGWLESLKKKGDAHE